jgi:hypothetical protein
MLKVMKFRFNESNYKVLHVLLRNYLIAKVNPVALTELREGYVSIACPLNFCLYYTQ